MPSRKRGWLGSGDDRARASVEAFTVCMNLRVLDEIVCQLANRSG